MDKKGESGSFRSPPSGNAKSSPISVNNYYIRIVSTGKIRLDQSLYFTICNYEYLVTFDVHIVAGSVIELRESFSIYLFMKLKIAIGNKENRYQSLALDSVLKVL